MAVLLKLAVQDPTDVLDTFAAGALIRIERDTTSAMTGASEIGTKAVVAATTEYEYLDTTGVAGTHYYRTRYSTASPSVAANYSGYSTVFQAGAGAGVITLETAKTWTSVDDTADDGWLALAVQAVNRAGIGIVGVDLGPSPDTTRTYDGASAVKDGTRLWIPGGIRAFSDIDVSDDGSTWTAVEADVRIGPLTHLRQPGEPGAYIELAPYTTGVLGRFDSWKYVRITGTAFATFGWDSWPMDLVQDAVAAIQRMSLDRARGGQYPSEIAALRYLHLPLWRSYSARYFPMVA